MYIESENYYSQNVISSSRCLIVVCYRVSSISSNKIQIPIFEQTRKLARIVDYSVVYKNECQLCLNRFKHHSSIVSKSCQKYYIT